ncbi:hypothetical protein PROFUN_11482 [Planoprotostelium fungivorum]|uniref:Uncharacterized protein n=1 Tax=Planoprotostelium fungivorum TaxID=1890364 RepID=A0A2P6N9X4_9EUKA|nr:hypothetical protein PROFUN_11482 [Planoprotostelium fungivorum]
MSRFQSLNSYYPPVMSICATCQSEVPRSLVPRFEKPKFVPVLCSAATYLPQANSNFHALRRLVRLLLYRCPVTCGSTITGGRTSHPVEHRTSNSNDNMNCEFTSFDFEDDIYSWVEKKWSEEVHHEPQKEVVSRSDVTVPIYIPLMALSTEFELLEPLRSLQRKSYDNENRFLSPKPIIMLKPHSELLGKITGCNISVVLLNEKGTPLCSQEQQLMRGPCGEEAVITTPHLRTSSMSIRVSHRLVESKASLCFIVDYETEDGTKARCVVTSNCFNFVRDRRRNKGIKY